MSAPLFLTVLKKYLCQKNCNHKSAKLNYKNILNIWKYNFVYTIYAEQSVNLKKKI